MAGTEKFKVVQNFPKTFFVGLGTKLRTYDFEERKWMKAEVTGIMLNNQKVQITCEDGLDWWEEVRMLEDTKAYRFE